MRRWRGASTRLRQPCMRRKAVQHGGKISALPAMASPPRPRLAHHHDVGRAAPAAAAARPRRLHPAGRCGGVVKASAGHLCGGRACGGGRGAGRGPRCGRRCAPEAAVMHGEGCNGLLAIPAPQIQPRGRQGKRQTRSRRGQVEEPRPRRNGSKPPFSTYSVRSSARRTPGLALARASRAPLPLRKGRRAPPKATLCGRTQSSTFFDPAKVGAPTSSGVLCALRALRLLPGEAGCPPEVMGRFTGASSAHSLQCQADPGPGPGRMRAVAPTPPVAATSSRPPPRSSSRSAAARQPTHAPGGGLHARAKGDSKFFQRK